MNIEKVKKEMIDVGVITLYFFVCFAIFIVIKKLVLFQHNITFYGWSTAFIGALAIGKVVFVIDKSPIQKKMAGFKPINAILLKALSYASLVFLVSIIEKTIHYWIEDPLFGTWQSHLFGRGNGAMLLAHSIYIYFCFVGFFFIHFLVEIVGRKNLINLLTTKR
ncbi:MAG: hypothetical protein L3J29_00240 [Cyclobacteriaceae bacterium]|nr:hypothetical protein [Cyclobacteriaceae bacterium]